MYSQFKDRTVEKLIDIALERKSYINYEDVYTNYELWYKAPSEYGDSIKGELKLYDEDKNSSEHISKYRSIKKIDLYDDIKEYADTVLYGSNESVTYEWIEYRL